MWKAQKIELTKNSETSDEGDEFYDRYSLEINGVLISNHIEEGLSMDWYDNFPTWICTYCGEPLCNAGNMLSIKRHEKSLLFLPCFDRMESYLEYDCGDEDDTGDPECPPHEWYENGILEIDEAGLREFLGLLTGFDLQKIPLITDGEIEKVLEWETLVKVKPAGFMRIED